MGERVEEMRERERVGVLVWSQERMLRQSRAWKPGKRRTPIWRVGVGWGLDSG